MNALRRHVRLAAQSAEHALATAHDFSFRKLNGDGEIHLRDCAGKAILIVNVASAMRFHPAIP